MSLLYVNWASQKGSLFLTWGPHSNPQTYLCSIFTGFSVHCLFSSVQSLSCVQLCNPINRSMPGLPITNSRSSLKLMSIESVMPSSHLILCHPLHLLPPILPSIGSFPMSQLFAWGGQSTGASALASFLPKKSQGWSPTEWTGWISLQSKGLSRVFSNTTVQNHQFFGTQLSSQSSSHIDTWLLEKQQCWLDRPLLAR